MRSRRHARLRLHALAWLLGAVLAPASGLAADEAAPTPAARADFWLERLLAGPEPTTWEIPNFHQNLLLDAENNLAAVAPATLERLADPALRRHVQESRDANPWHAILAVLALVGPARPEVSRAWAVPALARDPLTLRRAALPVLAALADPADGPVLHDVLRRDVADRVLGPASVTALLRLGPPWDAAAVRAIFERAPVDQPDGTSSLWMAWPDAVPDAGAAARDDVLAWWAVLAEGAGPLVLETVRRGTSGRRRLDPAEMAAVPVAHALPRGREAAAVARARLASRGHAPARAAVADDLASGDAVLARLAARGSQASAAEADRPAARAAAAESLAGLRAGRAVAPATVRAHVARLRDDPSAEASLLLDDLLRAVPTDRAWREPLVDAYEALVARGQEDAAFAEGHLRGGTPAGTDLALFLARQVKSRALLDALERWHEEPASQPVRLRLRREIAFLYGFWTSRGGFDPERVGGFARRLATWVEDPADPSGHALAGTLTELGAPGDAVLAKGLRGPRRAVYLGALRSRPERYLAPEVAAAILEPVGGTTPTAERRAALEAVLLVAGSDGLAALASLAARLPPEARADVEVVLRIVRWRMPSRTPGP